MPRRSAAATAVPRPLPRQRSALVPTGLGIHRVRTYESQPWLDRVVEHPSPWCYVSVRDLRSVTSLACRRRRSWRNHLCGVDCGSHGWPAILSRSHPPRSPWNCASHCVTRYQSSKESEHIDTLMMPVSRRESYAARAGRVQVSRNRISGRGYAADFLTSALAPANMWSKTSIQVRLTECIETRWAAGTYSQQSASYALPLVTANAGLLLR